MAASGSTSPGTRNAEGHSVPSMVQKVLAKSIDLLTKVGSVNANLDRLSPTSSFGYPQIDCKNEKDGVPP